MDTITRAKLINRRVKGGANLTDSARLLTELLEAHDGDNLAMALHYQGFATVRQAEAVAAAEKVEKLEAQAREYAPQIADVLSGLAAIKRGKTPSNPHVTTVLIRKGYARDTATSRGVVLTEKGSRFAAQAKRFAGRLG